MTRFALQNSCVDIMTPAEKRRINGPANYLPTGRKAWYHKGFWRFCRNRAF
jgi:hypothetical protein